MMKQENFKGLLERISKVAQEISREVTIMEVCGTHTQVVAKNGIRQILPKNIKLITGPGCPVCVTAQKDIDLVVNLALAGIPVATYGDALRVPGYFGSLEAARAKGAKVFAVYSISEALDLKKEYPEIVFFGLGFETTAPATAYAIRQGLTVYSTHKLFLPAMEAIIRMGEINVDGFLNPGHVSTIIGLLPYKKLNVAQVIAGFEREDVLVAVYMLLKQVATGQRTVENEYLRAVKEEGNPAAYQEIFKVFEVGDGDWRGFGAIPLSGLDIKKEYGAYDAKITHRQILSKVNMAPSPQNQACRCGEIIRGLIPPAKCRLFGRACTPENPLGPCMVSVEGACQVMFRYQ